MRQFDTGIETFHRSEWTINDQEVRRDLSEVAKASHSAANGHLTRRYTPRPEQASSEKQKTLRIVRA
jgi:trehalose/maltose hydrolase-like predicted phosphorylase